LGDESNKAAIANGGREKPGQKTLRQACLPARVRIRNHGAQLRQNLGDSSPVQIQSKGFLSESAAMDTVEFSPHEARLSLASEILRKFGVLRLAVYGSSMVPTIFPGEVVTVHRVAASEVQCGDVVLYARGGRVFAHRVVRKGGTPGRMAWVTRGDALSENDPLVSERELLGNVTTIVRGKNQIVIRQHRSIPSRVAAWCAQRFNLALALSLRWNALRGRLAASKRDAAMTTQSPEWTW